MSTLRQIERIREESVARMQGLTTRFEDAQCGPSTDALANDEIMRRRSSPLEVHSGGVLIARCWTADEAIEGHRLAIANGFGKVKIRVSATRQILADDDTDLEAIREDLEDECYSIPADRDYTVELTESDKVFLAHHSNF